MLVLVSQAALLLVSIHHSCKVRENKKIENELFEAEQSQRYEEAICENKITMINPVNILLIYRFGNKLFAQIK